MYIFHYHVCWQDNIALQNKRQIECFLDSSHILIWDIFTSEALSCLKLEPEMDIL